MSLLKNASTNRSRRRESLNRQSPPSELISTINSYVSPLYPVIDLVQEPNYALGYKSSQSKIIHLKRGDLVIAVKGIRALWGYLYGLTSKGTPIAISSLLEYVNGQSNRKDIKGWTLNNNIDITQYKTLVIHKPKCIKLLTNNANKLLEIMNEIHPNDSSIWRISYKDLNL